MLNAKQTPLFLLNMLIVYCVSLLFEPMYHRKFLVGVNQLGNKNVSDSDSIPNCLLYLFATDLVLLHGPIQSNPTLCCCLSHMSKMLDRAEKSSTKSKSKSSTNVLSLQVM